MKNADMPAMPITNNDLAGSLELGANGSKGMTKREMIAMHISGHVMQSLNYGAIDGEWDFLSWEELAKHTVQYTDALLKELQND